MFDKVYAFFIGMICLFVSVFFSGEQLSENGLKTYCTDLSSSRPFVTEESLSVKPNPFIYKGESVFVKGECDIGEIVKKYRARTVDIRRNGNITEYYMFSPNLRESVYVGGKRVNLHVAVAPYGYTVGTPFIYCGY